LDRVVIVIAGPPAILIDLRCTFREKDPKFGLRLRREFGSQHRGSAAASPFDPTHNLIGKGSSRKRSSHDIHRHVFGCRAWLLASELPKSRIIIRVCASELGAQGADFRVALHLRSFGVAGGPVIALSPLWRQSWVPEQSYVHYLILLSTSLWVTA
jgi:hypothetical protein